MKPNFRPLRLLATAPLWLAAGLLAQQATPPEKPTAAAPSKTELAETVVLSPFEVTAESDDDYYARETMAGTRIKTDLKDVPAQVSIMTEQFLQDIASVSIDDAFRYSANVENTQEFMSATNASGDFNQGVINLSSSNRVRGLTSPGTTQNFFRTSMQRDSYNTERVTLSCGPNSILFGNGNPAGIVDTSYSRANLRRPRYSVSFRTDDEQSLRTALDLNQPLIKNKLAVRVAGVKTNSNEWRSPGGEDSQRLFATVTVQPFATTTVRAYYETAHIDRYIARNTRIGDQVTPWIAAGRPIFDNGLANPTASPAANDPVFSRNTSTRNVLAMGATASTTPFLVWGSAATAAITSAATRYSVVTKGPGEAPFQSGADSYIYSLTASSISPREVAVNGNGTRNLMDGRVKGFSVEQRVGQNLFFELAFNQEHNLNPASDFLRGIESAVKVDANKYLPDRVTPNPNVGRYYVEGSGRGTIFLRDNKEIRLTASYELDLTSKNKWLGKHRFAGLLQRAETFNTQQEFLSRSVPAGLPFDTVMNNYAGAAYNTTAYRAYLSNPKDASTGSLYYLSLPFDSLSSGYVLPDGATIYTLHNPWGGDSTAATLNHNRLDGKVFSMQNYLLKDRLVTTFGWRFDKSRGASATTPRRTSAANSAFLPFWEVPRPDNWSNFTEGNTFTSGAVLHVLPWISVHYNQSSTWNPPRSGSHNPDRSIIPGSIGEGRDYGIAFSFLKNRVSLRLNKYRNTSGPDISTFRTQILTPIRDIEETIQDAVDAGTIPAQPKTGGFDPAVAVANIFYYDVVSNQVSEGYEAELTANPTKNWRLTLNGAKSGTTESEVGKVWTDFIRERLPIWSKFPDLAGPNNTATTIRTRVQGIIETLNLMRQADGRRTEQGREWRANFVSRYSFTGDSRLKGAFVGGGYRWRSAGVLGYRSTTVENAFPFPGIADQIRVPALDAPIKGRPINETELFFGYSHKLAKGVDWRVQLNMRNVFNDTRLVEQRANTSGAVTIWAAAQPRSIILTNSFTF